MNTKELYLLRHGETGCSGRYTGATDVPLAVAGKKQIAGLAASMRQRGIETVVCSPMLRCRQTMELLELPCRQYYDDRLREIDFGRWEGKSFAEIAAIDQAMVDRWAIDPASFVFPEGEAVQAFAGRVAAFRTHLECMAEKCILIISHGGFIRHLLCLLLGLPIDRYLAFEVGAGGLCSVRLHPEGGVLTGFNLPG